jgi:hypothetical protein
MAKIRSILGACSIEIAQHRRTCYRDRNNHTIPKGTPCLVIRNATSGSKNYCPQCALAILDKAADDLASLRQALE